MELGLYLHFPFCISKCPYCDFNSYQLKDDNQISSYISAFYQEITAYSQKLKKSNIKTIYLGGGTPTILSGVQIYNILEFCKDKFTIDKNAEITIEANPGTLDGEKIKILIESGINRLSLGAQSFNDLFLKKLGRIHNTQDIIDSYFLAREIGFSNINIDIMFALPGQTTEDFQATLKKAVSLKSDHLSLYNLTIKPGTEYYENYKSNILKLPSEDEEYDMYHWAIKFLKENSFEHYEIANFARPHKRSLHNLNYWQNQPYLGIGAGAYSFIRGYRYMNFKDPAKYIKEVMNDKLPIDHGEKLSLRNRMIETIILGLRIKDGVSYKKYKTRFGINLNDIFSKQIDKLVNLGLLKKDDCKIKLTNKGIFLANIVFREFVD
ncbi:MAG: oxygen-independent coproporphyrinogen III oxidase [Candidatus Atribacteria bacterium]|nr:oxygen-independent coproporphyrinogen III oxidase [Candidatus Atribacteria bacterium]MBE3093012.1 oxygen-independent coproporphyrinogen III oxidase [Chloroflexota bacterium]MBE3126865.1 oxygen-independent coproporphyrinogen III oxidase [Candidatus Atribacteria bacterium]